MTIIQASNPPSVGRGIGSDTASLLEQPHPLRRATIAETLAGVDHAPLSQRLSTGSLPRRLDLTHGVLEHPLFVPVHLHVAASRLRDDFLATLPPPPPPPPAVEQAPVEDEDRGDEPASTAELVARYLAYLVRVVDQTKDEAADAARRLLTLVLDDFERAFCRGNDIHALAAALPGLDRQKNHVLQSYYVARRAAGRDSDNHPPPPLVRAALADEARIYAIFGGQGNAEGCVDELRQLYTTYGALVGGFITSWSELLYSLARHPGASREYARGLDVMAWLHDPELTPSAEYLVSAPVSSPLIGLVQLVHYSVTCKILGTTPGEFLRCLSGATGHSQGIVVATAVAAADTWESFDQLAKSALTILFWIGTRCQQSYPSFSLAPAKIQDSVDHDEGVPSPMLTLSNLPRDQAQKQMDEINRHLPTDRQMVVSLVNSPRNVVVSGPPSTLCALNVRLRGIKAAPDVDQTRIPFAQRKSRFVHRFLPVSVPFHSDYLEDAIPLIEADLRHVGIGSANLRIPVYATDTGEDLQASGTADLVPALIRMIAKDAVDWPRASTFPEATHVLDFGPGGLAGVGILTHRNKAGMGVRVIITGALSGTNSEVGYRPEIYDRDATAPKYGVDWRKKFGPKLMKTATGDVLVDTRMSRLLGTPPVMVAGMTPCTVPWDFVAAVTNAGYHVELAGGGYHDARAMTDALTKLENAIPAGRGITINLIYINPRAMQWQIPLIRQLRAGGLPIDGLTIGAGVPSIEVANEYITTLDLKHISFKPGSTDAIRQVLKIAQANPKFPIILQWTGGRGGGHHSYEDFHQPILQMYGAIRKCNNVILVAGSGFGGAEDTYPYLTGTWSTAFGSAAMPFDGCLFGSRVMTAREAHTSSAAKGAIAAAAGLDDGDWESTYKGAAGGVITVLSEMGEPIHKLATRGVLFWAEMDRTIFSLAKEKRVAELTRRRAYIIKKLNDDFQKVWFGRNAAGETVDVEDMTYREVVSRMVELMFVGSESRWIDASYLSLVGDFIRRVEERSAVVDGQASLLRSYDDLSDPYPVIQTILSACSAAEQLISAEDLRYLLLLCRRPGQKPVPFVPVLDEDFAIWMKKDSLWQCEDLAAVVGQDVGRTCILQGPVAVKFSTMVDEPVKNILDGVHEAHIARLMQDVYGDGADIPRVDCLGGLVTEVEPHKYVDGLTVTVDGSKITYHLSASPTAVLPDSDTWLALLGGPPGSWRHALLVSKSILQDRILQANPARRLFTPTRGVVVEIVHADEPERTVISMWDVSRAATASQLLDIKLRAGGEINLRMFAQRTAEGEPIALMLRYTYDPRPSGCSIHEIMEDRDDRVNAFYYRLWFGNADPSSPNDPVTAKYDGGSSVVHRHAIDHFVRAVGIRSEEFSAQPGKNTGAPMDFAIVVAWKAIMQPLFSKAIGGDLLRLVHLSNGFKMVQDATPLRAEDQVQVTSQVNSIVIQDAGKMVEVAGVIWRDGDAVMEITSQFLYRGTYTDFESTFQKTQETPTQVRLNSARDVAVLLSKAWFHLDKPDTVILGQTLTFRLQSIVRFKSKTTFSSIETVGQVLIEGRTTTAPVATVEYQAGFSRGNPVVEYLRRHGSALEGRVHLEAGISLTGKSPLVIASPESNETYADASGDFNPIHVSRIFSDYVDLPGTITHGMYSSAAVRHAVDRWAAGDHAGSMRRFDASFVGMVLPQDQIEIELQHIGMIAGRKIIRVEATSQRSGEKVLTAEAEIEPPVTTYLFTGQGSQLPKMGMDLYASSAVARGIWDTADQFFEQNYGFLITEIVKNNPKELTIHFGGRRGQQVRQNYMSMVCEMPAADGKPLRSERIFKEVDHQSTSYTHRSPKGLLFATQFAQPALTIMEMARFEDMKSRGLISPASSFAGHSLGEYSALAAIAGIMPIERLLSTVFYRGLTMKLAVERDDAGRSDFGMVAVDPSRISPAFDERMLKCLVDCIAAETHLLLEIVNYNIDGKQYVCAGDLRALECLTKAGNRLAAQRKEIGPLARQSLDALRAYMGPIVRECVLPTSTGTGTSTPSSKQLELARGAATIPLKGIDVPFHSSYLLPSMNSFRKVLLQNVDEASIDPAKLIDKYVPNLTAAPFQITREYFERVYRLTGSRRLEDILARWDDDAVQGEGEGDMDGLDEGNGQAVGVGLGAACVPCR
ncbi:MAG: beta subunit of fatty acid synthetase [Phylliscum demangeonii]|nr:MAG: beta subunit of fatty acid synthetase [Phylliscum demangeonii]